MIEPPAPARAGPSRTVWLGPRPRSINYTTFVRPGYTRPSRASTRTTWSKSPT